MGTMIYTRHARIEWGDCDPAGIIFYPTYFRWIDAASWALFDAAGYGAKWSIMPTTPPVPARSSTRTRSNGASATCTR